MTTDVLEGGFSEGSSQSARAFRAALDAMSRPGRRFSLSGARPPSPLSVAAGVLVLTLVDDTTPLHLAGAHDTQAVRDWVRFHTGAPLVAPEDAVFALGTWHALCPTDRFAIGTPDYPDRAATLMCEITDAHIPVRLTGPGIADFAQCSLPDPAAFVANHARYPLGWDAFLTQGDQVVGLPRSTQVEPL